MRSGRRASTYEVTAKGEEALAAAVARYRLLEQVAAPRRLRPAKP